MDSGHSLTGLVFLDTLDVGVGEEINIGEYCKTHTGRSGFHGHP